MTKQPKTETQPKPKSQTKTKPAVVEPTSYQVELVEQLDLSGAVNGDGLQAQAARLGDPGLQMAQRQTLAAQIGRGQGNQHLQRVMASMRGGQKAGVAAGRGAKTSAASSSQAELADTELFEEGLGSSGPPTMAVGQPPADKETTVTLQPMPAEKAENGQQLDPQQTLTRLAIQRQGAPAPAPPPSVTVAPLAITAGTRQKFPLQYRLLNFQEPDQVEATFISHSAPVSVVEDVTFPSHPNQTGNIVLEAATTEGSGTLTLGLQYKGDSIESDPITINVTSGPLMPSSPNRIFFDTDSDAIRPDAATGLAQVAARLKAEPDLVVKLEGHADSRYTDEYNVKLSYRRALSARNYLVTTLGVKPNRVPEEFVMGWGEAVPAISPEVDPSQFQLNRRVELIFAKGPEAEEVPPTLRLNPNKVVAEVGKQFTLSYEVLDVHDTDKYGGASLTSVGDVHRVDGSLPRMPGGETGVLTMEAGATPGNARVTVGIIYGGANYDSNTVDVEIVQLPSADYIVPFDRNPLSAPGERIIFNARLGHAQPADFQLVYTGLGGGFDAAGGADTKTIPGLSSGNLFFFINSTWDGTTAVTVQLQVQRIADKTIFHTFNWTFNQKPYFPTTITQQNGEGERPLPSAYSYKIGPDRNGDAVDDYLHQTILERFEQRSCNITLAELKPEFRRAHPEITGPAQITAHFFGTSSNNGTFTVSAGDMIYDRHSGGMSDLSVFQAALITMKEIHVDLPQIYEAEPGVALGRYLIRRILKTDGTKKMRKMKQ